MFTKFKKYIKEKLRIIKRILTHIHSHFVKKEENIWVFGAIQGNKYLDNSKYLFEYVCNHTDVTAIWLSKNSQVIDVLRSKGLPVFHMHSKEGIDYAIKANVAVITHRGNNNNADLPFYAFSSKTKIIQLWHGIPLKKIAFDDKVFSFRVNETSMSYKWKEFKKNILFPYNKHLHKPDMILALSDETKKIFANAFRLPEEHVVVTGYPRNDILFENKLSKKALEKKKIIYMPTFRGKIGSNFDLFLRYDFNTIEIDNFLNKINAQLYIKLHPFNKPSGHLLQEIRLSRNIKFFGDDDIYQSLVEFDILITDYSSIYFDYLLLNRPIIFTPFDKDTYLKKDREFYFDYESVTPGPKAMNWQEVMQDVEQFLKYPESFSKERDQLKNRFYTHQDANSAKRVYLKIKELYIEQ